MRRISVLVALLLMSTAVGVARADGIGKFTVSGSTASAKLELLGGIEADLTLEFEQVVGLSLANLGLSIRAATPGELASRLPGGAALPLAFPMLISIEPPASGPLSLTGVVLIGLHTHNLEYLPGTPFRLFKAENGGMFEDVSESMGKGSYRVRGSTGGFCEFLIVSDSRSTTSVVDSKFQRLEQNLDTHLTEVPEAVASALGDALDAAWAAYQSGDAASAIAALTTFAETVEAHSGSEIPDVWRAARDLVDVAGELRSGAATLQFSLGLLPPAG